MSIPKTKCERLSDGDIVFYPRKYESYDQFREQYLEITYVTKLLMTRLRLLLDYQNSNTEHLKIKLECNEIAIRSNAPRTIIQSIVFNDTFHAEEVNKAIDNLVQILKQRLNEGLYETTHPDKIKRLLEKLDIYDGSLFIKPALDD